jgi:archaeosine-15-forming tRNA-guanine transglycosylase
MTPIKNESGKQISVGSSVRAYPGTSREVRGVVIEDFGDFSGHAVDVGEHHIVDAARRWAVRVYDDTLVFVDDDDIVAD